MTGYMSRHMRHNCGVTGCYLDRLPPWDEYIECLPRGIRPTDVDGMVEIGGRFLFLEEKQQGASVPNGQRTALRRLADFHDVTVAIFRPGARSELEVLIYDGTAPQGFQPYTRAQFKSWLSNWALMATATPSTTTRRCGHTGQRHHAQPRPTTSDSGGGRMIRPDGPMIQRPTSPRCAACTAGSHDCAGEVATGRQVPDRDPYRDRTRLLPEMVACGCDVCAGVAS